MGLAMDVRCVTDSVRLHGATVQLVSVQQAKHSVFCAPPPPLKETKNVGSADSNKFTHLTVLCTMRTAAILTKGTTSELLGADGCRA